MGLVIERISRSKCCRCKSLKEVEMTIDNNDTPLINKISLNSLNYKGQIIEELVGGNYYICDDCWNDLIDFFKGEDKNEEN